MIESYLTSIRPAWLAELVKTIAGVERRVVDTEWGHFYVDPGTLLGKYLITDGIHEPSMVETITSLLAPGDVYVDLGANEGYFSVVAGQLVGEEGRILAVEPQSRLLEVIRENADLNDVNIETAHWAVSDIEGVSTLQLAPMINSGSSGFIRKTWYPLPTEEVQTTTLGALLDQREINVVDLLKIDIEGHEYEAVLGSRAVFESQRVSAIALELHPDLLRDAGQSPDAVTDFLIDCGYRRDPQFENLVFRADK